MSPWTGASFKKRHNKKLTASQAAKAAKIANGILESTGDEALAIRTANKRIKQLRARGRNSSRR